MESILTKKQTRTYGPVSDKKLVTDYGLGACLTATVRYDDECSNGHNSFAITGHVITTRSKRQNDIEAGGCLHEDIARLFPELAPYIKWHLTSSDGPMHYVANTLYWLGYSGFCDGKQNSPPNLKNARATAVWLDMPDSLLATCPDAVADVATRKANVTTILEKRLDALLADFRTAVESLGFTY
jgi:hypothetical protein